MALYNAAGTQITRAQLLALTTADPDPEVTLTEEIFEDTEFEGGGSGREIKWAAGTTLKTSQIDDAYGIATVTAIAPAGGAAAGGTAVTITGEGFTRGKDFIPGNDEPVSGTATVTVGGVACTAVVVVSDTEITAVTGAHAAGATDVIVTTPAGPSNTLAGAFTYA